MANTYIFGAGIMWGTPVTDANGVPITSPTPVRLGTMQEMSMDFDFPTKELYGTYQFPVAIARGKAKVSGKAKFAQYNALALNTIIFGEPNYPAQGGTNQVQIIYDEADTIPATPGPYTITVAQGASWVADMGVRYQSTNTSLRRVATAPAAGQYTVAATGGVYTFAAADQGSPLFFDYKYAQATSTNWSTRLTQHLLGNYPLWVMDALATYAGQEVTIQLNAVIGSKTAYLNTKVDDFSILEMDYSAFTDSSGTLGIITTPNL